MNSKHWIVLIGLALAGLGLFTWKIGTPNRLVSDEWYYVQDAQDYAAHRPYVDVHPPLGKLQIAGAIAIFGNEAWAWRIQCLVGRLDRLKFS